ncbi:MAG: helix-turn-helix domain-containing protein [Eubacterium sp.]|nr:helix-turn-helix domain-containing protein [Eubacterium sp.]
MPKIIEGVREGLIEAARKHLMSGEEGTFSLRDIAAECGIAVGTVYNYFPNKDMLIATAISDDWLAVLKSVDADMKKAAAFDDAIAALTSCIRRFRKRYDRIFNSSTMKVDAARFMQGKLVLRNQMKERLQSAAEHFGRTRILRNVNALSTALYECAFMDTCSMEELLALFAELE